MSRFHSLAVLLVAAVVTAVVSGRATAAAEPTAGSADSRAETSAADRAATQTVDVREELAAMRVALARIGEDYRAGRYDQAYRAARSVYLDHFEYVEIPLRVVDPDFTLEMEYRFADLRSKIRDRVPASDVDAAIVAIDGGLANVARLLQGPGTIVPGLAFGFSFSIIFREGLEAVLILAALLGYLESSRRRDLKRHVVRGALLSLPATAATWAVATYALRVAPLGREVLEAATSLVAVAVLFYVCFWLLQRVEHRRWLEFVQARAWTALAGGSGLALATLAFSTVYREGFESVLFYQALLLMARGVEAWVGWGFVAGASALVAVGLSVLHFGLRLPVKALLGSAVGLMMLLSVAFLGNAVRELQNAGLVGVTSLFGLIPRLPPYLAEFTGLHPTVETLAAQAGLALVYAAGAAYTFLLLPARTGSRRTVPSRTTAGTGAHPSGGGGDRVL
ncbi:MAG: FTR1 family protein [Clostridia bacterium]|nr:FTR1 family protein [Clostridia bacterium]